jgi:hypothetical protein
MYRIINPQQRDGSLVRGFQTANLADSRFKDARRNIVPNFSIHQVKTIPQQFLSRVASRRILCGIVVRTEFRDQLG